MNEAMELRELLVGIIDVVPEHNCIIEGLAIDSRIIKKGDLFLACKGAKTDGRFFIKEAIDRGAAAVICDSNFPGGNNEVVVSIENIPVFEIPELKMRLGMIAAKFYNYPSKRLVVIGVTGTNGKTSVTHYIANLLNKLNVPCGVIGSLGIGFPNNLVGSQNTTPDPITLQRSMNELVKKGAKAVAIEVSSQGLIEGRVLGVNFTIGVFTNLTREHLDYHRTMENYGKAKQLLFTSYHLKYAIINGDDDFGMIIAEKISQSAEKISQSTEVVFYTISNKIFSKLATVVMADNIRFKFRSIIADLIMSHGNFVLNTKILGLFNLSNLLAVIAVLEKMGIIIEEILPLIALLKPIDGRMDFYGGDRKKPLVVIDYAHTPDALEKVLVTLRKYCKGALWCVFGCGGERDRGKRATMGEIAERNSDRVVITNDNPRHEDQHQIVGDIVKGITCPWALEIEYDRTTAIQYAINNAGIMDVVLIAGKGHEEYQIIGDSKLPHRDKEVVLEAIK